MSFKHHATSNYVVMVRSCGGRLGGRGACLAAVLPRVTMQELFGTVSAMLDYFTT